MPTAKIVMQLYTELKNIFLNILLIWRAGGQLGFVRLFSSSPHTPRTPRTPLFSASPLALISFYFTAGVSFSFPTHPWAQKFSFFFPLAMHFRNSNVYFLHIFPFLLFCILIFPESRNWKYRRVTMPTCQGRTCGKIRTQLVGWKKGLPILWAHTYIQTYITGAS